MMRMPEHTHAAEVAWVNRLNNKIWELNFGLFDISQLIARLEAWGYNVTYPEDFKKAYWEKKEETSEGKV